MCNRICIYPYPLLNDLRNNIVNHKVTLIMDMKICIYQYNEVYLALSLEKKIFFEMMYQLFVFCLFDRYFALSVLKLSLKGF